MSDPKCFKPCCHGSRSAAFMGRDDSGRNAVSNLVVMEVGQRRYLADLLASVYGVSNLVVMEVGQRPLAQVRFWNTNPKFQTLLSWKSVSGYRLRAFCPQPQEVSNLVVMEVGQRRVRSIGLAHWVVFQTLLSWKSVSGTLSSRYGRQHTEFQTLLSWKSVSGFNAMRRSAFSQSFKPCCHGSRSAASAFSSASPSVQLFQTLLSWKSVSGWPAASEARPLRCFKPCCHGSRSAASWVDDESGRMLFQTLLSWKSVSGGILLIC